ncbi:MAG: 2-dehydropantoate 2-reductase [Candidatus Tectomicrobia bacterium]|uniref:2-dehydropantoate 2-reductase n=1 Tax=Tectimicrobiota bacterium TaxID=2528274 RepID=A0A933GM09_UNCTE|nr:2-dehydropantoate 2-reductase [Candidatus Tectomicrobia bacterium]
MRFAVFGTGGVGGYFGGRLANSGENVIFIARGKHLKAIREKGLRVDSVRGDFLIAPAEAIDDPAQVGIVDVVILGVKTWQIPETAIAMRPLVGMKTVVLPLQNGLEAPDQLAAVLGVEHVLGGLARILSFVVEPGHIRHIGGPASITFGELDNRKSRRVERLRQIFKRAGVVAEIAPDIHVALWEKFLFVAAAGGLGAVTRAPIGVLRGLPETRRMLEQAMEEIFRVARARNICLHDDTVVKTMKFADSLPSAGTSSLQRDIISGHPSELEAWNGAVMRMGQLVEIPTPLNKFIYHSLLPSELQARGRVTFPTEGKQEALE